MKNIILCFDGTCNEPKDAAQEREWFGFGKRKDNSITNVLKLHLLFGGDFQGNSVFAEQACFYYSGVGTYGSWLDRLRNMAFAPPDEDVGRIIKNGINDLYNSYEEGDRLFIFGFSRGAAIARRFASVLSNTFPALGIDAPKITFLGVFDTVAAIQRPNIFKANIKPASDVVFENKTISPLIESALHLVALDERRIAFYPALMNKQDEVTEMWFPGAHADIGGGYMYDGLSDITLQFMLDYIDEKNLGLKTISPNEVKYDNLFTGSDEFIDYDDVIIKPNHRDKNHSQSAITKLKKATLSYRAPRVSVNDLPSINKPKVHHSVFDRLNDVANYDCISLRTNMVNPYTGTEVGLDVWFDKDSSKEFGSLDKAKASLLELT